MKIPYIIEPAYSNSIWAKATLNGIKKEAMSKKYTLVELDETLFHDFSAVSLLISEPRIVLVMGTSHSWVLKTVSFLHTHKVSAIVINYDPPEYLHPLGIVHINYAQGMQHLIEYLHACGKNKIALYGLNPNSSTDIMKERYIQNLYKNYKEHIFYNEASLSNCYQHFRTMYQHFDSVICTNDIAAVSLLTYLKKDNISVPEQLFLTCFGNSMLTIRTSPGITAVSLDHSETGRQAVKLYAYLARQDKQTSVSVQVHAKLTVRGSTAMLPDSNISADSLLHQENIDFYSDLEAQKLFSVEQLLSTATAIDFKIMQGLLKGLSHEELQENLFLSDSSLRYHIKYLMQSANTETRHEFLDFLQTWKDVLFPYL